MNKKNIDEDKNFIAGPGCSLKKVLDLIGGKWKILITNTMLANSLKELDDMQPVKEP